MPEETGRSIDGIETPEEIRERRRTRRFFNFVAPAFMIIDRNLLPAYRECLEKLDFPGQWSVLDLATGTGTLARAFGERGHAVCGIDFAERLLKKARKRLPGGDFRRMDLARLNKFSDRSFDIVSMGYLLHGISPAFRRFIIREASRIAAHRILIFDYPLPGPWYVRLIEAIEGPHYRSFVSTPFRSWAREMGLNIIRRGVVDRHGGWWLAEIPGVGAPPSSVG